MYNAWIRGIAANLGAPAEILIRLLDAGWLDYYADDREFPVEVIEAILARGSLTALHTLSKNPFIDPEYRGRMVDAATVGPEGVAVWYYLLHGPHQWNWPRPLPVWAIERIGLALDFERDKQYIDIARSGTAIPGPIVLSFWNHSEPRLRAWSCQYWSRMSDAMRGTLLADPDPEVRARAAAAAHPFTPDEFDYSAPMGPRDEMPMIMSPDEQVRNSTLRNGCVATDVVDRVLAGQPVDGTQQSRWLQDLGALAANPAVPTEYLPRFLALGCAQSLTARPDLTPDIIRALATHPDLNVRRQVVLNPLLSEEERRAIADGFAAENAELSRGRSAYMMDVQSSPPADMDKLISQATSALAPVRSVAAANRFLPVEYVLRLAVDKHLDVRLALSMGHPEAPPPLLAKTWIECPDQRRSLVSRPDFPREVMHGLAFCADHPDPDVRILATYDPGLPPHVAERLSQDAERAISTAAMKHPNLPLATIRRLLTEPKIMPWFVEAAAANPSLPVEDMNDILDVQIALGGR